MGFSAPCSPNLNNDVKLDVRFAITAIVLVFLENFAVTGWIGIIDKFIVIFLVKKIFIQLVF